MDYEQSLRELGVPPDAGLDEIRRAYKRQANQLKDLMINALRTEAKEEYRQQLRRLVCCRDVAMGREPPEDWHVSRFPISSTSLMGRLRTLSRKRLDRRKARAFLGLPLDASESSVNTAYEYRSRVLMRRLARSKQDEELATVHKSRKALRQVRDIAL